jgi:hypothetical protein
MTGKLLERVDGGPWVAVLDVDFAVDSHGDWFGAELAAAQGRHEILPGDGVLFTLAREPCAAVYACVCHVRHHFVYELGQGSVV